MKKLTYIFVFFLLFIFLAPQKGFALPGLTKKKLEEAQKKAAEKARQLRRAQAIKLGSPMVIFYSDASFRGSAFYLYPDDVVKDLSIKPAAPWSKRKEMTRKFFKGLKDPALHKRIGPWWGVRARRISSIRIIGDAAVAIYTGRNFYGRKWITKTSISNLQRLKIGVPWRPGPTWNDCIMSVMVMEGKGVIPSSKPPKPRPRTFLPGRDSKGVPTWKQLPGKAKDVGASGSDAVWVIGINKEAGGFGIYRWIGKNWKKIPGSAVRIDTDAKGNAWIVNRQGGIFQYNGKTWISRPGKAKDIGVGVNGHVWVIGANRESGGYGIYRWTGKTWKKIPGSAIRIDVDSRGNAWVVNKQGGIYQFDGKKWLKKPGAARDITLLERDDVYIVGMDKRPAGYGIWRFIRAYRSGLKKSPARWEKVSDPGGAVQISGNSLGYIWVVNSRDNIFKFGR
ncbi:tectonin domain-containing protein [Candidatus Riflebacteria bacterium]